MRHLCIYLVLFFASLTPALSSAQDVSSDKGEHATYDQEFVWFERLSKINRNGIVFTSWSTAYKGKGQQRLKPEAFYHEVGRPDLAEAYASNATRASWAGGLATAGLLGAIGGGTWWMIEGLGDDEADTTLPMAVTLGGAVMGLTGIILSPGQIHPVSRSRARQLVDQHNQKLRDELGVPDDYSPLPPPPSKPVSYNLSVGATPGGIAGVLRVDF